MKIRDFTLLFLMPFLIPALNSCTKSDADGNDYLLPVEDPSVSVDIEYQEENKPTSVSFYVDFSETTSYVNIYEGNGIIGTPRVIKKSQTVSYSGLDPDTEYCYSLIPYNKDGKVGKSQLLKLKTGYLPYENYFCFKDKYYEITSVTTSVDRNQGNSNWKNLRFNTNTDTKFVLFTRPSPKYEGVDSYWYDGTYTIQESGSFYEYIGWFNTGSGINSASGTLKIETTSAGRLFTFTLYYGSALSGRVLTKK